MRLTIDLLAKTLKLEASRLCAAVDSGLIYADSDGKIDLLIGQAFARAVSAETHQLFGDTLPLPAPDAVFVEGLAPEDVQSDDLAADGRLDLFSYGLAGVGRMFVQTTDPVAWVSRHGGTLTESTTNLCLLIRQTDNTEHRAITDSYLLGDSRLQLSITQLVEDTRVLSSAE